MNNIFQKLLLLFLSIITTILLLEVALRLTGSTAFIKEYVKKPKIYIQDNVLGWNTKEGNYFYDIDSENKVNFYFLNDGSRFSGKELNEQNNSKKIILVGGSFTMGHKINNEETISFYLQESFEFYHFLSLSMIFIGIYLFENKNKINDYILKRKLNVRQ